MAPKMIQSNHYYGIAIPLWILIFMVSSTLWFQVICGIILFGYFTAVCSLVVDENTRHRGNDGKFK